MLPQIARHLIYPLHERLLGRSTFRFARELERSQWFSPDELRALQESKLRLLLRHASAHTRFYRRRLDDTGIDVRGDLTLDTLSRLPLLNKAVIRAAGDDIRWQGAPGGLFEHNTGGSTGEPLIFHFDRRRQGYDQAARIRTHRWFGVDIGDRELYVWGSPIEHRRTDFVKRLRDRLCNHRLLDAFDMSPARMDAYLDEWERFAPACVFGYPSSLALLVEHASKRGRSLQGDSLRVAFVTGEVCYPHHRKTLEDGFGVPVADGYGSREAGFIAHQCPAGGMHIMAENVIVEVLRDGRPAPPGTLGEIVLTHLDAYAMPFIRYRIGDVGRLKAGRCACGRGLPMMDVVQGRATDFLYLPDGNIKHALSVIYPLRRLPNVRQFRVMQDQDYTVTVHVVPDGPREVSTREAVVRGIRPVIGDTVALRVEMVDEIAAPESGKYCYVVSQAGPRSSPCSSEVATGV